MKKHLHKVEFKIPLYEGMFVVILTNDKERLRGHIPEFNDEIIFGHTFYTNWDGYGGYVVVLNFDSGFKKMSHGVISHEALHACLMIAEDRGFVPDFENSEPLAYLIGWITDQIYSVIEKHGFKVSLG